MNQCPQCQAPLIRLDSQDKKICVDQPLMHIIDNKLKEDQEKLIKATR